jgi:site-specific DNA-adenine methylase
MVYIGSKRRIKKYIIPIIESYITPNTTAYIEPMGGGAEMS